MTWLASTRVGRPGQVPGNSSLTEPGDGDRWVPDEIDLAAIRVVGRSLLARAFEPEFQTITGYTFADVETLRAQAATTVRDRTSGAGWVRVVVGERRVQFPMRIVRRSPLNRHSIHLIAVPTASTWAAVYPHMRDAFSIRPEAMETLAKRSYPPGSVEEFDAESYWDLEQQATELARHLSFCRASPQTRSSGRRPNS